MTQLDDPDNTSGARLDTPMLAPPSGIATQTQNRLADHSRRPMQTNPSSHNISVERSNIDPTNPVSLAPLVPTNANPDKQAKKTSPGPKCPICPLKQFNSDAEVKTHASHVHHLYYAITFEVNGVEGKHCVYLARGRAAYSLKCPSCPAAHQSPYTLVTHARKKHNWSLTTKISSLSASDFDACCFCGASQRRGYFLEGSNNDTTLVSGVDEADHLLLSPAISDSSIASFPSSPTPIRAGTRRSRPPVPTLDDESPPPKRTRVADETIAASLALEPTSQSAANEASMIASPTAAGATDDIEDDEDEAMLDLPTDEIVPSGSPSPSPLPPDFISERQLTLNKDQTLIIDELLLPFQLRINKEHRVLLCIDPKCLHAVVPSAIITHLERQHHYSKLPSSLTSGIQRISDDYDVYETESIPIPAIETTPISGMFLVENGFKCTVKGCGLGFRCLKTGKNHWSKSHGSRRLKGYSPALEIVPSPVQGFFPKHRGYFPVQLPPPSLPSSVLDAYALCAEKQTSAMEDLLLPLTNANETPMMEKITHWFRHLTPYIGTRQKLDQVLALKKPIPLSDKSWLSSLRELVLGHMILVHTFAMAAGLDILVLLKCYATSEKEAFRALSDENTLEKYAQAILTLLLMCIRSVDAPPGSYRLPLDSKHIQLISELKSAIETNTDKHKSLHRFLVYALGPDEKAHAASEGEKDWDAIVSRMMKKQGKQAELTRTSRAVDQEDDDDFEITGDVPTYGLDSHVISEVDHMGKFNSIIDPYFAVLHMGTDGKMKPPNLVTQAFAQIAYFSRATTLCEGHYSFERLPELTLYKCVEKAAEVLLAPLQANAFNKAQNYTQYISSLAHNTARPVGCRVSDDGDEIQYGRSALSVLSLRLALQSSYEKAETMLTALCRGSESAWTFPLGFVDDWRKSERGYGLPNAGDWLKTLHPLANAIMTDDPTFFSTDETGQLTIDREKVATFLSSTRELLSLLSILLFIIPGQSPRAAEHLDHKLVNGQKDRTVFLGPNHNIWLVTRRTKTETQTHKEVFVPRVLPKRLRWIFLTYILVVRPVEVQLCALLHGSERALVQNEFLFANEGVRTSRHIFSTELRNWFETGQGVKEMGTRNYRHIMTELCRLFIGNQLLEALRGAQDIFAEQQMHSRRTAEDMYAPEIDHLAGVTSDKLHASIKACTAWWDTLGVLEGSAGRLPLNSQIRRRLDSGHSGYTTVLQPEGSELNPAVVQAIADIVSKTAVETLVPTIQGLFRAQENRLMEKFQLAMATSAAMQTMSNSGLDDMFMTSSTTSTSATTSTPITTTLVTSGLSLGSFDGPSALEKISSTGPSALDFLNRVLKSSTPSFSSNSQQKMIEHAIQQDSSAVIVLPTGGGKSMLWNVVGMTTDDSFMVVMSHTTSLLEDQKCSTEALGIPCETWSVSTGSAPKPKTKVVYVALETIVSAGYYHENQRRIRGIAIDEAHSVLTDDHRLDKYRKLKCLTEYCTKPRFLLTATLPYVHEDLVIRNAGLLPQSTPVYRESLRQRVRYTVKARPASMQDADLALAINKEATPVLRAKGWKAIIFVTSIDACRKIGAVFGNSISHSEMPRAEKDANEKAWKDGRNPFLVATSGFICGINMPDVGLVVFIEMPFGLINFVQGAGRAGRSSAVEATVLLIHNPHRSWSSLPATKEDRLLIRPGNDFIATTDCRRKVVSAEFNPVEDHERDCFDFQVHLNDSTFPPCDNCDSQEPVFHSLMQNLIRAAQKDPKPSTMGLSTSAAPISAATSTSSANIVTTPVHSARTAFLARQITEYNGTPAPGPSRLRAAPINDNDFFGVPSSPVPSSTPPITHFIPDSSPFSIGPVAQPISGVTPLQLANAQQSLGDVRKHQIVRVLNTILQRFRRKCIVCYLHGRGLLDVEQDLPHHTDIWTTCKRNCGSIMMNRLFQFKKEVNSIFKANGEKYKICYHCLLPQGQFLPDEHRAFVQGSNNPCWFEGIVPIILIFIYNTPSLMTEALAEPRFAGLSEYRGSHERFAEYFLVEENVGEHWKGLELVAWYWTRHHSQ